MKQKSGMIGVVYAAILSAIAGYFFRMTQLSGGSRKAAVQLGGSIDPDGLRLCARCGQSGKEVCL